MKTITREIKIYRYVFANVDIATGTIADKHTVENPVPLTRKQKKQYSEQWNNAVMVHTEEVPTRYSLPLTDFIKACEDYAAKVAAGKAKPITEDDIEESDDINEN